MREIPLARAAALQPFLTWLTAANVPIDRSLQHAHLEGYSWERPETPAPFLNMLNFVDDVANREGIKDLGFRVFSSETASDFGITGQFVTEAATPREALCRASRSMAYFNTHERISVSVDPLKPVLEVAFEHPYNAGGIHLAQQLTSRFFSTIVDVAGNGQSQLMRAEIIKKDGVALDTLRPWLGDNVGWSEAGTLKLFYQPGAFDRPFSGRFVPNRAEDALTGKWLKLKDRPTLIEALRVQIEEMLIEGEPSVNQVADAIGVSTRTLQRRLTEADTSFSDLLDDVRYVKAMAEISGSARPLVSISSDLGYSTQACFSRAVRRWEARTARDIRLNVVNGNTNA